MCFKVTWGEITYLVRIYNNEKLTIGLNICLEHSGICLEKYPYDIENTFVYMGPWIKNMFVKCRWYKMFV